MFFDESGCSVNVIVQQVGRSAPQQVVIQCYEVTDQIKSILRFIRSCDTILAGYQNERMTQLPLQDIFYVEAVEGRVFAYTAGQVFELKCKLYEFETLYQGEQFFRCGKSMVVNLMKIDSVSSILNGRFSARLFNGEEVIISRQYVPALKELLSGGMV